MYLTKSKLVFSKYFLPLFLPSTHNIFSHVTKADIRIVPSKRRGGHNRLQEPRGNRQEGDEIYT